MKSLVTPGERQAYYHTDVNSHGKGALPAIPGESPSLTVRQAPPRVQTILLVKHGDPAALVSATAERGANGSKERDL